MFWRRSRAKEAAEEETDDLAKLQKQFGIRPVSDADVQVELQALLAATGSTGGSSPTAESLLFGAGGDEEEDEEAKILRDLQLDRLNLDDEEVESDGHREAKNELRGVLDEVHQTARENHSREAAEMSGKAPARGLKEGGEAVTLTPQRAAQVQALKMEALALKREGKIQDALAKFREAKQLQGQVSSAQGHMANTSSSLAPTVQHDGAGKSERAPNETMLDDGDKDVEVTDEDMQDPEFLAQLAKMGLTEDDGDSGAAGAARNHNVMQQLSALETQIHECKVQAIQLKRQDQIADALACMRKIKELEVKRDELRSSAAISNQSPAVHLATAPAVTESVYHHVAVSSLTSVRLNSGAVPLDESQADSDIDSISDIEVTAEDMNDPAFAAELRNLGDDDAVSIAPTPLGTSIGTRSISVVTASVLKPTPPSSRLLKAAPSIDEDYLIDAFDESDSEGETNHLTTVMSSGSLRSASSVPEMAKAVASVEYMSVKAEVENYHIADLTAKLQKARQTALSLKRKGDIQGALESMRRAKQIQNLIDLKQHATDNPEATVGSAQNSATAAKFQEIEQLLVDFGNRAMALAKENLSVNREKASEWLAKRKRYGAELEKLRLSKQNPLQLPPHYEIVKTSLQVEYELPFIADDHVKVSVKSVRGLSQVAGKSVFVKFCLNFPSATPHEGQTAEFQISPNAPFAAEIPPSQTDFVFKLARSRGTMRLFEIKKAVFEVWKPGTLFRNPELVARAYQELTPLLTCCETSTHLPFLGSNRKPCGGDIEIAIKVRRPLKEKEIRLEAVEDLVIGAYPEPMASSSAQLTMPSVVLEPSPTEASNPSSKNAAAMSDDTRSMMKEDQPTSITAELDDPHHLDLIVSYDVVNEELEKVGAKLPSLSGPAAIEWSDRYDSLALKKQLLEIEMQTGKLTLDMYVERLHKRIAEDRTLMSKLLSSNRRLDAARVLHRIKIMEKELVGADGDSAES
ncbi:hypothetical protein PC129_g1169 [Phytophthora cactorum]|uniref:Uncharacterized protein n=1 Tax=Phytophthora cactorum TaxID=29920 RepID=A0A8T1IVU9_9STRA|nr:hypothetical protein Pcac1_g20806 [Phytophthora cactorum]KAG3228291.1 hypothetical protein PC129_g1169 [Phytophthora cactorum]